MSSTSANASQTSTIATGKVADMVVRKTIRVDVPQAHAFSVFTEHFGLWWPLSTHKIGKQDAVTAIIEPKRGGRWFERSADGTECDWGRVQVWEPPRRLVLTWEVSADWQRDTTIHTEVEVTFVSDGPNRTIVHLEHRKLEEYGEQAEMIRSIFDSEGGWSGILQRFANAATSAELGQEVPCPSDNK
jgi:uncharacterized protein YndB with AHSA1/START domain